jgi:hypothetical protein
MAINWWGVMLEPPQLAIVEKEIPSPQITKIVLAQFVLSDLWRVPIFDLLWQSDRNRETNH